MGRSPAVLSVVQPEDRQMPLSVLFLPRPGLHRDGLGHKSHMVRTLGTAFVCRGPPATEPWAEASLSLDSEVEHSLSLKPNPLPQMLSTVSALLKRQFQGRLGG